MFSVRPYKIKSKKTKKQITDKYKCTYSSPNKMFNGDKKSRVCQKERAKKQKLLHVNTTMCLWKYFNYIIINVLFTITPVGGHYYFFSFANGLRANRRNSRWDGRVPTPIDKFICFLIIVYKLCCLYVCVPACVCVCVVCALLICAVLQKAMSSHALHSRFCTICFIKMCIFIAYSVWLAMN